MRTIGFLAVAALALSGTALAKEHKDHKKKHGGGGLELMSDPPSASPTPSATPAAPAAGDSSLTLNCSPPGADVYIDGELVTKAPIEMPVPVRAGSHTIKVVKLGFAPYLDTFNTKGKKVVKLEVELIPLTGVLHVKSNIAEARVLIDGRFVGVAPLDVEMEVGARAIQVEKGCYKEFFKDVLASAGREEQLDVTLQPLPDAINPCIVKPLPPPKWYQKKWVWGAIGGGAAAVAVAVLTTVLVITLRPGPLDGADVVFDLSKALTGR